MGEGLHDRGVAEVADTGNAGVVGMTLPDDAPARGNQLGSVDAAAEAEAGRIMDAYIAEQHLLGRIGVPAVRGAVAGQ